MVYRPWTSPSTSLSYAALNALIGCLPTVRILYAIDPVEVLDLHFRWSGDRSDLGKTVRWDGGLCYAPAADVGGGEVLGRAVS